MHDMKLARPPEILESERIVLKKHELSLAPLMFEFVDRDRERLRRFLPWVDTTTKVEDEVKYIQFALESWDQFTLFDYGIFRRGDDQYMGNIGFHSISWENERTEVGYWILGEFEGRGYMSEAVSALEKVGFEMGFHRIEIRCSAKNLRSAKVPERCGYTLEARLREDAIVSGDRRDTLIFAKVKEASLSAPEDWPLETQARFQQALSERRAGQLQKAKAILSDIVKSHPEHALLCYQLACTCDAAGDEAEAVIHYENAIRLGLSGEDRVGAFLGLGSTYRCLGKYQKSLDVFDRGLTEFADDHALKTFRALTLFNLGKAELCVEELICQLVETTADRDLKSYGRALKFYSDKLHQTWPDSE